MFNRESGKTAKTEIKPRLLVALIANERNTLIESGYARPHARPYARPHPVPTCKLIPGIQYLCRNASNSKLTF